jgi:2-amino-4-hydroxy-6-hydroxymethyldihydropteridine diphosphokinase
MGDKRFNCDSGISALAAADQIDVLDQSLYYRTEPVDYEDQDWFVNCVVKFRTKLSPVSLFKVVKAIEFHAGRSKKGVRFGPRILDMDILLYDTLVLVKPELVIPHPRMHKRRFVLGPFCDINSNTLHPVLKKTVQDLLNRLDAETQRIVPY